MSSEKHHADNPLPGEWRWRSLAGSMNELVIELEHVVVRREFLEILHREAEIGGMSSGRLAIGEISAAPEMVYFLWHDSREAPVSMLIRREHLATEDGTREAARDFLTKWQRRLG